eukprot:Blabericola_migrator_1__760@NODE_118_length_13653_cov_35_432504_g106_i0_p6_GENE_NODE_118_length_13653_cov_35_432504_g106_i0NODE_118_length_13653_cov_35_432504_g106_i0_p6_ORF_typecomplete_len148_score21_84_NODE_118_length_13653_cov_35_432504_g106_i011531596
MLSTISVASMPDSNSTASNPEAPFESVRSEGGESIGQSEKLCRTMPLGEGPNDGSKVAGEGGVSSAAIPSGSTLTDSDIIILGEATSSSREADSDILGDLMLFEELEQLSRGEDPNAAGVESTEGTEALAHETSETTRASTLDGDSG